MNRKQRRAHVRGGGSFPSQVRANAPVLFGEACRCHQAGRRDEAERLCRQVLALDPLHADALHLAGLVAFAKGRVDSALDLIGRAIAVNGTAVAYHANLGTLLARCGRLDGAVAAFNTAIGLDPGNAVIHSNLGNILRDLGRLDEAIAACAIAIRLKPDYAKAHANLGNALKDLRRFDDAAGAYGVALRLDAGLHEVHANLGGVLVHLGRLDEAVGACASAIRLNPDYAGAHSNLGNALKALGRLDDAIAAYDTAIRLKPDFAEAHSNLGNALMYNKYFDEAATACRTAIRLKPDFASAHSNLGAVMAKLGRLDEGIAACETAIRLKPDEAEAHSNRGAILVALGRLDEGIAAFETSIRLKPEYAEAHANLAFPLLLKGDWSAGWEQYEWRRRCCGSDLASGRFDAPEWRGEPLDGLTLLIRLEQGMGDVLQVCRYAKAIKERKGRIVLLVHPPLVRLLSTMPDLDWVVATGDALPPFDRHIPLMSLPRVMGTTVETIPADIPYLEADQAAAARMRDSLGGLRRKIGFVWRGNPRHENDRIRSIDLDRLEPLFAAGGTTFVALQKDPTPREVELLARHANVVDASGLLGDFADTAVLLAGLDLVISVDTSVVHLAGALGRPVWVLLPLVPDWRWLLGRDDSPWYPTARLFRQSESGDWDAVIDRVGEALRAHMDSLTPVP